MLCNASPRNKKKRKKKKEKKPNNNGHKGQSNEAQGPCQKTQLD